jgi:hypothetical protein
MVFRVPCLATSPTDIEHDLDVIPGIIKRRDIDLSPPVGEWPLFALIGRLESTSSRHRVFVTANIHKSSRAAEAMPIDAGVATPRRG